MMNRTLRSCFLRSNFSQPTAIMSSILHRSLRRTLITTALMLLALAAAPATQAQTQTCDNISQSGTESISAHISIRDTTTAVTEGKVVPAGGRFHLHHCAYSSFHTSFK